MSRLRRLTLDGVRGVSAKGWVHLTALRALEFLDIRPSFFGSPILPTTLAYIAPRLPALSSLRCRSVHAVWLLKLEAPMLELRELGRVGVCPYVCVCVSVFAFIDIRKSGAESEHLQRLWELCPKLENLCSKLCSTL